MCISTVPAARSIPAIKAGTAGTFRLCALGAIDEGDIRAFFRVFRDALDGCGVAVPVRYGG